MFNFFKNKQNDFKNFIPEKNNVLLIESNGCHGEVIGGYIKYFQELGYNVYCLVNERVKKENPFARLTNVKKIFYTKFKKLSKLMKSEYLNRYDKLIIMSSVNYTGGENTITDLYPDIKQHKSVYYVHHDSQYIKSRYGDIDLKHNIMLGRFPDCIYINPHLFGEYTIPQKSDETIFICVGGINPKRKNHTLLLDAIEKLHNKNYKFKVLIVGSGSLKHISKTAKQHIQLLGHLNYDDMYDYVESANFFLPLLDDKNPDHDKYITIQVTGSAQLVYGFRKIPVIHEHFADFYSFDDKNAVLYTDLVNGMENAINMSQSDYNKYIKNLDKTANDIYKESLNNLKDILNA